MKICLVSKYYPPEKGYGGIGTYVYNLAQGLSTLGHAVHVICHCPRGEEEKEYLDNKVFVHRIKKEKEIRGLWRLEEIIPISIFLHSIRVAQKINHLINNHQIEIVEFPNWNAEGFWFLLQRKKIPTIVRVHTPHFEVLSINKDEKISVMPLRDKIICWMEKFTIFKSDQVTSSTFFHRANMAKFLNINPNRIKIVPLGIDISNIKGEHFLSFQKKLNFKILFVSRLEKRKGIDALLSVAPCLIDRYPHVQLFLVGEDNKKHYQIKFQERFGNKYNENINFLGFVEKEELEEQYKNCDLFVVPSRYESFGLVYLEAMKYGKAVIGGIKGGIPEVVGDGKTGFLVDPDDLDALEKAINSLIENEEARRRMGESAFKMVRDKFSRERMVQETAKVYLDTLNLFKNGINYAKS